MTPTGATIVGTLVEIRDTSLVLDRHTHIMLPSGLKVEALVVGERLMITVTQKGGGGLPSASSATRCEKRTIMAGGMIRRLHVGRRARGRARLGPPGPSIRSSRKSSTRRGQARVPLSSSLVSTTAFAGSRHPPQPYLSLADFLP